MYSQSRYNKEMNRVRSYSWLLFCFYPFGALLLGWAEWDWGKRAYEDRAFFNCIFQGLCLLGFIHFALVLPQTKWVWKYEGEGLSRMKCVAVSTLLLSLPLIGFGYWVGEVRTILQAQEVTISMIPAVLLSTLIYDVTRNLWKWSLSLWFLIFYQTFLISEILGPFHCYLALLSHDNRYEYLRALVPAITIAWYFRMHYQSEGRAYLGINAIHHSWKRSRFAKVFKATNPGKSSLQSQTKSSMGN